MYKSKKFAGGVINVDAFKAQLDHQSTKKMLKDLPKQENSTDKPKIKKYEKIKVKSPEVTPTVS